MQARPRQIDVGEEGFKQYQETMPKLGLELNTRVLVRLNSLNSNSVPLQGEFIGISHYDFLVIRLPCIPGLLKKLLPSTSLEIRYITDGAINNFNVEIISHTFKPALLLYVTYPDRMNVLKTRKHQRLSCALPVTLRSTLGEASAVLCDLSKGGCRVVLELTGQSGMRTLGVEDAVMLQVVLCPKGTSVRGLGIVRNVEVTGTRLCVGIAFGDNTKAFDEALDSYLDLIQVLV